MLRVALLAPLEESVPPLLYGGTERVIHNLARGLIDAGCDVTLFASGDSHAPGVLRPMTRRAFRLDDHRPEYPAAYSYRMMTEVVAQAEEFDVIHNHHDFWMLPLSRMTRTPMVTTLHGRLDQPDLALAYSSFPSASFISISDSQREPLPNVHWQRTIYHGLDLDNLQFHPRPGKYLAFLGRICPDKGPHRAIRIAQEAGIPLKIAAKIEPGESQEYYDQAIRPHVDGHNVEYVGEISENEKSDFLGEALGLVFPIDWPEPFGLVMAESLACGTPVLARPCGSVSEILEDGLTGFIHADESTLARRALELEGFDRAGCRRYAERRFSIQRMTEDYIDVYHRLFEDRVTQLPQSHRRDFLYPLKRPAL